MINKVILLGRIGTDPQARVFEDGTKMVKVSMVTTEKITNPTTGNNTEYSQWHTLIFRKRLADIAEMYVAKGSLIYIEGKLRTRQWEDSSKISHLAVEIYVDELKMISSPQREDVNKKDVGIEKVYDSDDLPF